MEDRSPILSLTFFAIIASFNVLNGCGVGVEEREIDLTLGYLWVL
jgi:hypothetical protein